MVDPSFIRPYLHGDAGEVTREGEREGVKVQF
jgi:hypothetical protein